MNEQWALFGKTVQEARSQRVERATPTRLYWRNSTTGEQHWIARALVFGVFPSFEAADDAKRAAQRAYEDAYQGPWRNALNSPLAAARQAISAAPGYRPARIICSVAEQQRSLRDGDNNSLIPNRGASKK